MLYLELFLRYMMIGLFTFGGGYASLPLIQEQLVEAAKWLTMQEFTDLITVSQMTPGPIFINAATFAGMRIGGVGGAAVATFASNVPSIVIISVLAWLYKKYKDIPVIKGALAGLRPATVGLIFSTGFSILYLSLWGEQGFFGGIFNIDFLALGLFAVGLFLLRKFKLSPIFIILGCGIIGGAGYMLI